MERLEHSLWVEKYRPTTLDTYIGNEHLKSKVSVYLESGDLPHLLLYGKAGTGKTTLAKLLVNNIDCDYLYINASDENGIDTIRSKVVGFSQTKSLDGKHKVVILDEADSMTSDAQLALRQIVVNNTKRGRFCLICNYICKIEASLKNEFLCIRFNQLPKQEIFSFVNTICEKEGLNIENDIIENIQHTYQSDIRSIINFLQLNPTISKKNTNLITKEELNIIYYKLQHDSLDDTIKFIHNLSISYNIDKKNILLHFFSYLMRDLNIIEPFICDFAETIIHSNCINNNNLLKYFIFMMKDFFKQNII